MKKVELNTHHKQLQEDVCWPLFGRGLGCFALRRDWLGGSLCA